MIRNITTFSLIALSSIFSMQANARVELGRVGTHQLRLSDPSTTSQLVSVPFLKEAISRGRLNGVNVSNANFSDIEGAFNQVDDAATYILRVTGGSAAGSWFFLGASSDNGTNVEVIDDGFAGSLSDLAGDETFAVHALYTLSELLPEDGQLLPSGDIDLKAAQVHFYDGREFKKLWLSNGTITSHQGWTSADAGELVYAGDTAILPGTSFLVLDTRPEATVDIRVQGVVLDAPLNIPVYPGYNFVASNYNKHLIGDAAFDLDNIGLKESGFQAGASADDADQVLAYDASIGRFGDNYYLDESTDEFSSPENGFKPGDGFVVFNAGEKYLWSPAQ